MIVQQPTAGSGQSTTTNQERSNFGSAMLTLAHLVLVGVVLLLALVNLPYAPRTWFDEGSHLHVPKTLVQHGVYADISSEGYRYYGPTIGVGPTVMLPVALMFKLFGVGLLQGRLVVTGYLLVALVACYALGRRLHGAGVGLLALLLLLASRTFLGNNHDGMIEYGRQVLGEVPGIAFLVLGVLAWTKAVGIRQMAVGTELPLHDHGRLRTADTRLVILAGLGFGLALVTKNQFVLVVPPTLALIALLDWRYYRMGNWYLRLVPLVIACGCYGLWMLAQFTFLGSGSFFENMQQTRQAARGAIFVFDTDATLRALKYVLRPDLYGGLLLPALAYAGWRARRRDAQGLCEALIAVMVALWLVWYIGASLGWPRYAFPAIVFGAFMVARLLTDAWRWLRCGSTRMQWVAAGGAVYVALAIAGPLVFSFKGVFSPDDSAQRVAAYLDQTVPKDVIVETWEPELGLLTDHRYHYPPINLLDIAVRHEWLGGPPLVYDGVQDTPPYVVVGPFGHYTNIYYSDALYDNYRIIQEIGPYTLFKRES